jgi:DNA-directed RNA polymerase specialized sigma24 family protein
VTEPALSIALSVEAFNGFLARFQAALVRFVRSLVGNSEDARDLVQDVFVDAWRATQRQTPPFTGLADEGAVRNWLFHAAYCNAISALRRRGVITWESLAMRWCRSVRWTQVAGVCHAPRNPVSARQQWPHPAGGEPVHRRLARRWHAGALHPHLRHRCHPRPRRRRAVSRGGRCVTAQNARS